LTLLAGFKVFNGFFMALGGGLLIPMQRLSLIFGYAASG